MRILLVDDDDLLTQSLSEHLIAQHYVVDVAANGLMGQHYAQAVPYDLLVLDVNLPQIDGLRLCRMLRQQGQTAPILLLTAKGEMTDKITGLDAGADDYVVKPCTVEEVSARIRALLRRPNLIESQVLRWGNLTLNPATCEVMGNDQPISLSPKEYSLLELFLRHPLRIFSSSSLLEQLWSLEETPGEDTIRSHIKRLRRKLKTSRCDDMIDTVYGMGYRLKSPSCPKPVEPITPSSSVEEQARTAAIALRQKFQQPLQDRLMLLDQAVIALQRGHWSEEIRQAATHAAHKLAGSLAMFGFPRGSQIGRAIEYWLQHSSVTSEGAHLKTLVDELHQMLRQSPEGSLATAMKIQPDLCGFTKPHLLIINKDTISAAEIRAEEKQWDINITVANTLTEARLQLASHFPQVVILEPEVSENAADYLILLQELTHLNPAPAVILWANQDDFADRLNAVRQGCDRFIPKIKPLSQVLPVVRQLLQQKISPPIKALVVDDDPAVLDWLNQNLPLWGIYPTTLRTSQQIWQALEATLPDIAILDLHLPEVNGIELCRVIRSDSSWGNLPILFLTACQDPEIIVKIYQSGADDCLHKPCTPSEIVTRIFNRLQRKRASLQAV